MTDQPTFRCGHPRDESNTAVRSDRGVRCRTCVNYKSVECMRRLRAGRPHNPIGRPITRPETIERRIAEYLAPR